MPDRSDDYQLPSWPRTKLDPDLWNAVMGDIAARLKARELLEASFEVLQEQGIQAALDYIQVSIAPQLAGLKQDIIDAQAKIDEILTGNAPNAQKLGGQLPSYYAKAQATAEALGALAVDISLINTAVNGLNTAVSARMPKSGGAFTGGVSGTTLSLAAINTILLLTGFTSTQSGDQFKMIPTDFGVGKPFFFINKLGVANEYAIGLWDGATGNGNIRAGANWVFGNAIKVGGAGTFLSTEGNIDFSGNMLAYGNRLSEALAIRMHKTADKATGADITAGTENKFPDAKAVKEGIAANVPPGFGVGQTWQQPARSIGTSYQNTTGKPIQVYVAWSEQNYIERQFQISTDNVNWFTIRNFAGEVWAIIPTGHYYRIASQGVLAYWRELR